MAINTVNARYEGFIFDGENSRTYGVYVTDVKVFGTPVRNVEMVTIPGRNGAFSLDNGNFENIEIKYTCAMSADTPADFNDAISDLRNMLASRIGYKRLEDEINTSEYRMAVYKGGLEVPTMNKKTGTFDVVFDCKPQRFLKSGETAVSVADGGTITNPTLFDSRPMLEIDGYGTISINDDDITVNNQPIGVILLKNKQTNAPANTIIPVESLEVGDSITIDSLSLTLSYTDLVNISNLSVSYSLPKFTVEYDRSTSDNVRRLTLIWKSIPTFYKGTSATDTRAVTVEFSDSTGSYEYAYSVALSYDGADTITVSYPYTYTHTGTKTITTTSVLAIGNIYGDSTMASLGNPLYFDLDIGEAYKIEGGGIVSVNSGVSFPAELPVLKPGANTIAYDNTVTDFKIVPRWWKV